MCWEDNKVGVATRCRLKTVVWELELERNYLGIGTKLSVHFEVLVYILTFDECSTPVPSQDECGLMCSLHGVEEISLWWCWTFCVPWVPGLKGSNSVCCLISGKSARNWKRLASVHLANEMQDLNFMIRATNVSGKKTEHTWDSLCAHNLSAV
jgi:hypothetical protein